MKRWRFSLLLIITLFLHGCALHAQKANAPFKHQVYAAREINGWLLVENCPSTIRHRVLLLPGLLCTDLIYTDLLNDRKLAEAGILLAAGNPPGFKGLAARKDFNYSIESYAQEVENLTKLESYDLIVGHSFFGNVLIEVAARNQYPGRLILLSPSLFRGAEDLDMRTMERICHIPGFGPFSLWASYQIMESGFSPYITEDKQYFVEYMASEGRKTPPEVTKQLLISFFDHMDRYGDLAERLISSENPVWYVRGDLDNVKLTDEDRSLLNKSAHVKVKDIPGTKHFAMIDKPEVLADLITQILSWDITGKP